MGGLKFLAFLFSVIFLFAANTSAYSTTITTVQISDETVEENRVGWAECKRQLREHDLSQCERYIAQPRGGGSALTLRMPTDEKEENQEKQNLQWCCYQIRQVRQPCQCEVLKSVVMEQQRGKMRGEEMQVIMRRASTIPIYCHLPQQCQW